MIKLFVSQRPFFSRPNIAFMPTWNHFCTFSSNLLLRSRFSNENVISERAPSAQSHSHRWSSVSLPLYAGRSCFIPGCFSLRGKRYGLQSLRAFIVLGSADWACWREIVEGKWEMSFFFSCSTSQFKPHTRGHKGTWVDTLEQIVVWNVKQCLSQPVIWYLLNFNGNRKRQGKSLNVAEDTCPCQLLLVLSHNPLNICKVMLFSSLCIDRISWLEFIWLKCALAEYIVGLMCIIQTFGVSTCFNVMLVAICYS